MWLILVHSSAFSQKTNISATSLYTHLLSLRKQIYPLDAHPLVRPTNIHSCLLRLATPPSSLTACSLDVAPCSSPIAPRPIDGCACPSQSPALLVPSPFVRPPSLSYMPLTPSWSRAARTHVSWCLSSSSAEARAPTSAAGASGAHAPRLAASSKFDDQNRPAPAFLPLCCICMFQVFQTFQMYIALFHLDVAKVD
jgi:hypothetical protein